MARTATVMNQSCDSMRAVAEVFIVSPGLIYKVPGSWMRKNVNTLKHSRHPLSPWTARMLSHGLYPIRTARPKLFASVLRHFEGNGKLVVPTRFRSLSVIEVAKIERIKRLSDFHARNGTRTKSARTKVGYGLRIPPCET